MLKCSTLVLTLASAALLAACGAGSNVLRGNDGKLAACGGPHCVSSTDVDPDYRVAPLGYTGSAEAARARLKAVIAADGGVVTDEAPDYLHATYTTAIMRYVDDVEFVFSPSGRIELRSSSRIGYSDLGKNRDRVEGIRRAFGATK